MRWRIAWVVLILGTALLFLGACDQSTPAIPTPSGRVLRIAAIFPSSITDNGWSQDGYKGLMLCKNQLGAEITYTDNLPGTKTDAVSAALSGYAEKKTFDLIIAHGDEYEKTIIDIAAKYPQQRFGIISGYTGNNANLSGITYTGGMPTYLMGAVAGLKTKTGKITYIRTQGKPDSNEAIQIARGIQAANPTAQYMGMQLVPDWNDPQDASAQAEKAIAAGVDVIIVNTDQGDKAVVDTARAHGVYVVPWTHSLASDANTNVVSAVDEHVEVLYLEAGREISEGRWSGHSYRYGLREHAIDMTPFLPGMLTPEAIGKFDQIKNSLIAGTVDTTAIPPNFKLESPLFSPA